jgi:hypothetical protein
MNNEYYKQLNHYIKQHDLEKANRVVMLELANIFLKNREDFVYMLQNSGIDANNENTDGELIDMFISNIHGNKKLLLGTAFLISHNNKVVSFDGDEELDEKGLKATHKVLYNYFDADAYDNYNINDDDYSNVVGGVYAGAIKAVAGIGNKVIEGQQKKKFGASDLLAKKTEAKNQMVQQIMAQRQAQQAASIEKQKQQDKQKKIILIGLGSLVLVGAIGAVIYFNKSKN